MDSTPAVMLRISLIQISNKIPANQEKKFRASSLLFGTNYSKLRNACCLLHNSELMIDWNRFFFSLNYQAGSGAHQASSLMDICGSFPRIMWSGREADHPPPFVTIQIMNVAITLLPPTHAMCREIFALT